MDWIGWISGWCEVKSTYGANNFCELKGRGMQFLSLVKIDTSSYSDLSIPFYRSGGHGLVQDFVLLGFRFVQCIRGCPHNMSIKLGGFKTPLLPLSAKKLLAEKSHNSIKISKDCRLVEGATDLTYQPASSDFIKSPWILTRSYWEKTDQEWVDE